MKSSTENVKQLKGDGLRVDVDVNDLNLKVSGDGCRVTVARNNGSIRVVGDGCSLKVNRNEGEIEYKGDGGSITLGGGSRTESVSYVGDGGRISVRSETKIGGRKPKRPAKKGDEIKKPFCSVSDSEIEVNLDNLANERKEAGENKGDSCRERNGKEKIHLRRSKTIVVTRISTEHVPVNVNSNNSIKSWFRGPPSVVRSFKSQPESL